jgi:hypothetical protein
MAGVKNVLSLLVLAVMLMAAPASAQSAISVSSETVVAP